MVIEEFAKLQGVQSLLAFVSSRGMISCFWNIDVLSVHSSKYSGGSEIKMALRILLFRD
jgi:hypothetical protein